MTKTRSYWGWGYEEEFPSENERAELRGLIGMVTGWSLPEPRAWPTLAEARIPTPRVAMPAALADFTTDDPRARATRTYGRGFPDLICGMSGDFNPAPDLVAMPRDEAEVAAVLAWASQRDVAVVPYGGGSSVVGGVECDGDGFRGVVCLDMGRMDRVLEVIPRSLHARIQAGALGPVLEAQLAAHGLTLRHFPQSFAHSTLGGWIATRAGGHFATNYTHIDDLVASVRMVTPSGVWESRRLPGSGAGPSPDRLVLGSEGTLGVITEAWMRVFPRPIHRSKASVHFADFSAAVAAVHSIAQSRLFPANCRLLDQREAMLNQVALGSHVLLLGFESATHPQHDSLDRAIALAVAQGGEVHDGPSHIAEDRSAHARSGAAAESWRSAFFRAPYRQTALATMGVIADTFETAIPWDRFEALHADVLGSVKATMREVAGGGLLSCRFTHVYPDGPAPYYTFLCPAAQRAPDTLARWRAIKTAASEALSRNGATITHHHAVGRLHRPWYDRQRPDLFAEALGAVKQRLDPASVLNPGVLID